MSTRAVAPLVILLASFGLVARLLPHPPNFVPIAAIALFAGYLFGPKWWTMAIPMAAMLVGDYLLGVYDYRIMAVVYAALALPVGMSYFLRRRFTLPRVSLAVATSSLLFFATTNFAVWCFGSLYTHDLTGLVECYVAAVPFFQFTIAGDLMWAGVLFGGLALSRIRIDAGAFALRPRIATPQK